MNLAGISNTQKLIFEAVDKVNKGKEMKEKGIKLMEEGWLEFEQLTDAINSSKVRKKGGVDVSAKIKAIKIKKPKDVADRLTDNVIKQVKDTIKNENFASITFIKKKLKMDWYVVKAAIDHLIKNNIADFVTKRRPTARSTKQYLALK